MDKDTIRGFFEESARIMRQCSTSASDTVQHIAEEIITCFEHGNKVLIFGNGGSASQAQHFAAELVNKYLSYRAALPAIALTTDTSVLTSIGNDLDFSEIFSRQVEALGSKGDIAWGLSTSGTSANVIKAMEAAKKAGLNTVCFAGEQGSALEHISDVTLTVASKSTPRIQEVHLCAGHAVCELVETYYLSKS